MRTIGLASERRGFTMIELVLAAGLLSILMIAVFALIDGSLVMWRKSETRRNLTEQATGVVQLMANDLRALEGGERGDLLVEWVTFDTNGDELKETVWPRLRFVRQASAAEIARMIREVPEPPAPTSAKDEGAESLTAEQQAAKDEAPEPTIAGDDPTFTGAALIEVCWAVVPLSVRDPEKRAEGLIYRGARRLSGKGSSYFDQNFIKSGGRPNTVELDEVSAGLLWFQPLMATQTSIVHSGWEIGTEPSDAATSWDAWRGERPDTTVHAWNQENRGMPVSKDSPLLPRRIRIELEFEREKDRERRPSLLDRLELTDVGFTVSDGRRLPKPGAYIKIEGEWMQLKDVRGDHVTVMRGQRGTETMIHDPGHMVHWGLPLVREVPVALYREDWDL